MRTLTMALVGLAALAPNVAAAEKPTLCQRAFDARASVVKQFGSRAPGRNICRYGVRHSTGRVEDATVEQKARYLRALKRMAHASRYLRPGAPRVPPAGTATPRAGGALDAIAACESGGNYRAVDPSGTYTGRYQFDDQTWQAMGGSGRAGDASPAEQDQRAAALYASRGAAPWPVCGR